MDLYIYSLMYGLHFLLQIPFRNRCLVTDMTATELSTEKFLRV